MFDTAVPRRLLGSLATLTVAIALIALPGPATAEQSESTLRSFAAASITAGDAHSCALLASGAVRCWGNNESGQLGYGNTETIGDDETPASAGNVPLGGKAVALAAGYAHTCALMNTGAVRCWGDNDSGQLGYGNTEDIGDDETPASAGDVPLGGKAKAITAGVFFTCAVMRFGAVRCWGDGSNGELGYGNTDVIGDNETPASVDSVVLGGKATAISGGGSHVCALLQHGALRCWGNGSSGKLGYGNTTAIGNDENPADAGDVPVGGVVKAVDVGTAHSCALLDTGAVRCWGNGIGGRLGYGNSDHVGDNETPASVGDIDLGGTAVGITAGGVHTCAVMSDRAVRCWGNGSDGRLGHGIEQSIGDNETPASAGDVAVGGAAAAVTTGGFHTCAVLGNGAVRCWGTGEDGQLGQADTAHIGDDETPATVGRVVLGGDVRIKAHTATSLRATPARDRRPAFKFRFRGSVTGAFIASGDTCGGKVSVLVKKGKRVLVRKKAPLRASCSYDTRVKITAAKLRAKKRSRLKVTVSYPGSALLNRSSRTRWVTAR